MNPEGYCELIFVLILMSPYLLFLGLFGLAYFLLKDK